MDQYSLNDGHKHMYEQDAMGDSLRYGIRCTPIQVEGRTYRCSCPSWWPWCLVRKREDADRGQGFLRLASQ
jgi:hypothetical protein